MQVTDYIILFIYGVGILFIGSLLAKKNRTAVDMFAVKKQSPWWLSGLSSFMSAFSAGTFVVWGGIAYKFGFVSVSILMCSGISSFLVGRFFAGKWASLGISTVGEYVLMRFGKAAVQFYTWVGMLFKIVAMGVALYSFAVLIASLVKLSPDNILADAHTGTLNISVAIIISGVLMLFYAVSGGLWAVLIIDAIQFVVLTFTVLFVVPLCFSEIGGVSVFLERIPKTFLSPTGGGFTYIFLFGWIIIHTFKLGGEWVFVQRFLAVSSPANAKKSSYLFGVLYIISPIIWMLPPMIYRVIDPNATPEQAYILACASVLPPGMMGLLIAAMFSSAASYIDGEVNVYAGAVTNDVYKQLINQNASEKKLVSVGRISSFLIGIVIISIAIVIPYIGGAQTVILTITGLLAVAMVLPVLWGLYFGRIKQNSIWWSTGLSIAAALFVKLVIPAKSGYPLITFYNNHIQVMEVATGILVPVIVLTYLELSGKPENPGYKRIVSLLQMNHLDTEAQALTDRSIAWFPAKLLGISIGVLALLITVLIFLSEKKYQFMIGLFAALLLLLSAVILFSIRNMKPQKN